MTRISDAQRAVSTLIHDEVEAAKDLAHRLAAALGSVSRDGRKTSRKRRRNKVVARLTRNPFAQSEPKAKKKVAARS